MKIYVFEIKYPMPKPYEKNVSSATLEDKNDTKSGDGKSDDAILALIIEQD